MGQSNLFHHYQNHSIQASIQGRQILCTKDHMQVSHIDRNIINMYCALLLFPFLFQYS